MAPCPPVTALLRILGVELAARLGRRVPPTATRTLSAGLLVGANLLPLWAVLEGRLGMGDVLLVYWFENVVVWFMTTVRLLTATRRRARTAALGLRGPRTARLEQFLASRSWVSGDPAFALLFAVHFGTFTLVHGLLTAVVASRAGLHGSLLDWVATTGAILSSHALSVGLNWFGRRERAVARPGWVMAAPYPRMFVLHLTVLGGFFLLGGPDGDTATDTGAVVLLVVAKTGLDVVSHVVEHLVLARHASSVAGAPEGSGDPVPVDPVPVDPVPVDPVPVGPGVPVGSGSAAPG
jgi:hypothetical protein